MVDFKRSYVSDYVFEPYPGDTDYDDPKARENVKRAYDNMKLGRPIFISTALLKGPFEQGWSKVPLGEQSRAERRTGRRAHNQPVPTTTQQIQAAELVLAISRRTQIPLPVPVIAPRTRERQPVTATSRQIQEARSYQAISHLIQKAQPRLKRRKLSQEEREPDGTEPGEEDDRTAELISIPQRTDSIQAHIPHPGLEAEESVDDYRQEVQHATCGIRRVAKDTENNSSVQLHIDTSHMSLRSAMQPVDVEAGRAASRSPTIENLPEEEEATAHDGLQPKQFDTASSPSQSAENADAEGILQLADGSVVIGELPVAAPPAEILEIASKDPAVSIDDEVQLPTPSKTRDDPASNLDLLQEVAEHHGERPAETNPQSGLITPDDSDETARSDPVIYVEDTFAETGPSGISIEAEAPQAQPISPRISPCHNEIEDIEDFTPVVNKVSTSRSPSHGAADSPLATPNPPPLAVDLPVFGFTAVNSSMAQAAVIPVAVPQQRSEPAASVPARAQPIAAPKSKVVKRAMKASGIAAQKSCLECGITQKKGWRRGPAGSATLCSKCGAKWYNKNKKQATATATNATSKKTKTATKKHGPTLDLAPHLQDTPHSFGVLSPRKERLTRAAKPTYSLAIPPLLADNYDTMQNGPSSQTPVPASARKKSLAFGVSPHQHVLDRMYGPNVLRTAMNLANIDKLKALLDDGFASHVTNRLELSSTRVRAQGTSRGMESDIPEIALAMPTERLRKPKAKRIMTFDSPTTVKAPPSKLRNKLSAGDAGEVTAQRQQLLQQDAPFTTPPQELVQVRSVSPVRPDVAEEEEIMVSALTSPAELIEPGNTSDDVEAPGQQTWISSSKRKSSQINAPSSAEVVSTQILLQGGVDLSSSLLESPALPPSSALVTPAASTTSAAKTVLPRVTPGSMGPPTSIPRSSNSVRSEDAAPANTQAMFAEFGGLTDDSSPQSMHSALSRSSLHMSPAFEKSPLSPRLKHNDVVTPASFFSLAKRPGQPLRSKFSPVMPESAGGDSIFRFADITEVPSQAVDQSQAEEDGDGLYDLDAIAQHGDSLLGLSQPHF